LCACALRHCEAPQLVASETKESTMVGGAGRRRRRAWAARGCWMGGAGRRQRAEEAADQGGAGADGGLGMGSVVAVYRN
jgi:hypothetical protein